jgi:signal transduction histidine kinase
MDAPNYQPELNALLASRLRPVMLGIGAFFAVLAGTHLLFQAGPFAPVLAAVAALTALALALAYFYSARHPVQLPQAHLAAGVILGLALGNFLLQLYLTGSPVQTVYLLLWIVGAGYWLLASRWLIILLILASLGWGLVARSLPPSAGWLEYGLALVCAVALSVAIHLANLHLSRQLIQQRRQEKRTRKELETVLNTTEKAQRSLAASLAVGQQITSILDLDDLLHQVVDLIRTRFGYYAVSIFLLDETQTYLVMQAISDQPGQGNAYLGTRYRIGEQGISGWAAAHHLLVNVPDVSQDPHYVAVDYLPDTRSELVIPLEMGRRLLGVLDLESERRAAFSEDDVVVIQLLADQVAIAIRNAQLYEQVRRFNLDLEDQVARRTDELQKAYDTLHSLDRAKSDFIDIASHELRTPLTVIQGYSQMLGEEQPIHSNEDYMRLIQGILSGSNRLNEIVESMLDVAKIDNRVLDLYPTPVPLASLVHFVIESLRPALIERQISLTEDLQMLPPIEADVDALRKVFYHLIVNAIKYTPDGGSIQIQGRVLPAGEYNLPGKNIEVEISDTGIGIAPGMQELIFRKFYQTGRVSAHSSGKTKFKGGGPGLGLAIARGIVELHHGKIWVVSEGHNEETCPGSHFHIVLPIQQK